MTLSDNSVVVLTGAASGIGRSLALRLCSENIAGIAISDVNEEGLSETVKFIGQTDSEVMSSVLDVSNRKDFESLSAEVVEKFGTATHIINNAGVGLVGRIDELSIEDIEWMMNINFWVTVYGTKIFLPIFQQQESGHIVNISSVFGLIAPPGQGAYSASKFAVRGFTEVLRHELEDTNISVSTVHPGGIKTNIARDARRGENTPAKDMKMASYMLEELSNTTADEAAQAIIRGIRSKNPRILIGSDARQISLVQRLFPKRYFRVMDFIKRGKLSKFK